MPNPLDFSNAYAKSALGDIMSGAQLVGAVSAGVPIKSIVDNQGSYTLPFPDRGNLGYRIMPKSDCSIEVSGGVKGQLQTLMLIIQQPYNGDCQVEFSNITFKQKPFIDSRQGSVSIIMVIFDGSSRYYGSVVY